MRKILLFMLFSGAALAGILLWLFIPHGASLTEKSLTFATIQHGTMVDVVSATGVVEPRDLVVVSTEAPGMVNVLLARVNDVVGEGTVLATLDDARIQLKVEEAENGVRTAQAALAQAEAARDAGEIGLKTQIDLENKGGFRSEREQAEAQAKAARAGVLAARARVQASETRLKEAKLALEQTQIKAPGNADSSGSRREYLVLERKAQLGQIVGPQGAPLFTLAGDLSSMEVHAQIAEGDINKVKKELTAVFTLSGFGDEDLEFRGRVKEIRPMAVNVKGAVYYDAVIEVPNQKDSITGEWRLRPGMTASVDIIRREHPNVWKVPSAALNFQLDEAYQSDAVRARVAEWKKRSDHDHWQTLWTWDAAERKPAPLFVRIGGLKNGAPGIKDSEGNEILEWEPGREPTPNQPPARVIIAAPPARTPGFFDQPANIKVS
ncbi:MAG TPA: efflux RND transporter periplasmic adaptor subunit [Gemmataceae bacterium]|nr:efflux RND transporter periplasmic adaptor subunit [Gemmataceae bacterium]